MSTPPAEPPQLRPLREYERWLGGASPGGVVMRWAMGPVGVFFANGPLLRLPESLQLDPSMRLLEIGCGRGALMRTLHERMRFDRAPVGVDFSGRALLLADRDERRAGRPSRLARGSATALPFNDGAFDLVLCGHVVKHLDDGELIGCLREIRRVLAERGLALLWEFAPTGNPRLDAWNRGVLSTGVRGPRLRSTRALLQAAELAGMAFRRDAQLRPFLFPPIPRASILVGRPPADGQEPPAAPSR